MVNLNDLIRDQAYSKFLEWQTEKHGDVQLSTFAKELWVAGYLAGRRN